VTPTIVRSISGTTRVLVCTGSICAQLDTATGATTPFGALPETIVGAGGWRDIAFAVDEQGNTLVRVGDAMFERRSFDKEVRAIATARDTRRFAVVLRGQTDVRDDHVAVGEVGHDGSLSWRWVDVPARDCIHVDAVALTPDGTHLGVSFLDVVYTVDGDWCAGQLQRAVVVDVERQAVVVEAHLGETYRPSECVPAPIALGSQAWFVGIAAVSAERPTVDLTETPSPTLGWTETLESVDVCDDGTVLALVHEARSGTSRLCVLRGDELVVRRDFPDLASSMALVDDRVAVAFSDGVVVLVDR
jgi:hypothetical protein